MTQEFREFLYQDWKRDVERFQKSKKRLVHYTSCDVAVKIIETSSIWMRVPLSMNDYEEIEFARSALVEAYNNDKVLQVRNSLDKKFEGFCKEFQEKMNFWMLRLDKSIFLFCLSEHESSEDQTGRLSMWRAYGRRNGAAIVISHEALNEEDNDSGDEAGVFLIPVKYAKREQMIEHFIKFFTGVRKFLKNNDLSREDLMNGLFYALILRIIRTKHIGFSEEKEWRLVILPDLYGSGGMEKKVVSIDGVPQLIGILNIKNLLLNKKSKI
jgi:hypothetical protein